MIEALALMNMWVAFCYVFIGMICIYIVINPNAFDDTPRDKWYPLVIWGGFLFFMGSGAHHFELALELMSNPYFFRNVEIFHFVLTELMQVLGSGAWVLYLSIQQYKRNRDASK